MQEEEDYEMYDSEGGNGELDVSQEQSSSTGQRRNASWQIHGGPRNLSLLSSPSQSGQLDSDAALFLATRRRENEEAAQRAAFDECMTLRPM
jgi:hypothetical protein